MNAFVNLTAATDSADVINLSACIAANFDILRRRKINLSMTCESNDGSLAQINSFVWNADFTTDANLRSTLSKY